MRTFYLAMTAIVVAVGATMATAQDRVARAPYATDQAAVANVSQGQAAIDRAAAAGKYVFIFFWREKSQQTDRAWNVFQSAAVALADSAEVVSIQATDPAEKRIVDKYNVESCPNAAGAGSRPVRRDH